MSGQTVMVSACLLGSRCRYDGGSKPVPQLKEWLKDVRIVPFCPEVLGDLTIPRPPAEIQNGAGSDVLRGTAQVVNRNGLDCTAAFIAGARKVLDIYYRESPQYVILKSNSPSCGVGRIHDGSFSDKMRNGDGVTAALLIQNGARVYTEEEFLLRARDLLE